ncbi:hypothetical protein BS50DRAFT_635367 [Corynespora cassiicola Philippines]|uniref:Uncharacterized protein n=1 Tax=Corynespora cassiicola Philippines TaxID=1448308 RepID=A0A2T2NLB4_CORCC|nr:hypothetical protein BS50DRAFT_635367 [Corynespora cassiicola Philippines]
MTSPSPLRTLFLTEAVLKVLGGTFFFLSPATILGDLAQPPYSAATLTLMRNLGTQTLAFSVPLFLAARRDPDSVRCRKLVYWALLGREGFLGLGLLWQIGKGWWGERRKVREAEEERGIEEGRGKGVVGREVEEGKFLRTGLWIWVAELAPFVLGRVWVLGYRERWFE